jgi:hypothetical protein
MLSAGPYECHIDCVKGYNAFVIYDAANCWINNVKVTDADMGVLVSGVDLVTVSGVTTAMTKSR